MGRSWRNILEEGRRPELNRALARLSHVPVLQIALVALAYWGGGRLGLELALVEQNVTPVWPPTGIAVAALLIFGRRIWPAIAIGAFAINAPISPTIAAAAAITAGNTLGPLAAAYLLQTFGFRYEMSRLKDPVLLVFLGALLPMTITATSGTATLAAAGVISSGSFASTWSVWWTGDAMGVLLIAPALLLLSRARLGSPSSWAKRIEAMVVFSGMSIIAYNITRSPSPHLFLLFPMLIWSAARFRQPGASAAALLTSATAILAAIEGVGPFSRTLAENMILLLMLIGAVSITSYFLAALASEWARSQQELHRARVELEDRVRERTEQLGRAVTQLGDREQQLAEAQELAHVGSWEWDITSDRVSWSDELFRLYGLAPQSNMVDYSSFLDRVHPDDRERVDAIVKKAYGDHKPFAFDHRIVKRDGSISWLHGRGRVVVGEDGQPKKMLGTGQDISERKRAEEAELLLQEETDARRHALDLNDDVVQGLVIAQYSLEAGETDRAFTAIESTIASARRIVSNLLHRKVTSMEVTPGDLVRKSPSELEDEEQSA